MGAALLGGMIESGTFPPERLCVVEVIEERRAELVGHVPRRPRRRPRSRPAARRCWRSNRPTPRTRHEPRSHAGATRVLSIAAGVRLATLDEAARGVAVIRAMPNTPALVGKGAAAIAAGATATDDDIAWAASILGSVGTVDVLPEALIDAFTGCRRLGAGVRLPDRRGARSTRPSPRASTGRRPDGSSASSCSARRCCSIGNSTRSGCASRSRLPGGTTAAGIAVFEEQGLRTMVADAVRAATERSRELG